MLIVQAALVVLPHRQYKTARTETRWHLLLKIGQMPPQTADSRGYVLFDIKMAFMPSVVWCRKGHTQKSYKLSSGMRTWPAECSKLGKTRIIADAVTGWLEMPHFLNRMFHRHSTRNRRGMLLIILLITPKRTLLIAAIPLHPQSSSFYFT